RRIFDQQDSSHVMPAPRSGVYVRTDCSEQFFPREWLGEVLLRADDAATRLVEQAVLGGQHDHRRGLEFLVALDQRAGLVAVEPRHHDVDEDDLGLLVGDLRQRLEPVAGRYDLAALALSRVSAVRRMVFESSMTRTRRPPNAPAGAVLSVITLFPRARG